MVHKLLRLTPESQYNSIISLVFIILLCTSCWSSKEKLSEPTENQETEVEESFVSEEDEYEDIDSFEDESNEENGNENFDGKSESSLEVKHPKYATIERTREILKSQARPSNTTLDRCLDGEFTEEHVSTVVSEDPETMHWCLYYKVVTQNDELEYASSKLIHEKFKNFNEIMRKLRHLSIALDKKYGSEKYFSYLKKIYIFQSKKHFARDLEQIPPNAHHLKNQVFEKPAGSQM